MPPTIITLTCWKLGDDPERLFVVNIENTMTVMRLRDAIKEKKNQTFQHVDSDMINLWKVSIPLNDEHFEERLKDLNTSNQTRLIARKTLSSYFSEKSEGCLDIVVHAPSVVVAPDPAQLLSLNCSLQVDGKQIYFTVKILKNDNVSILKSLIKEEHSNRLKHVVASDLMLSQVSLPLSSDLEESLKNVEFIPLEDFLPLSQVFPDVEEDHVHLVVQIDSDEHRDKRVRVKSPLPHTPISSGTAVPCMRFSQTPERTPANMAQEVQKTPPRIIESEIEPSMLLAFEPFTKYITYLAQGKLDGYFNSVRREALVTALEMGLPTEPVLLLHDLGNDIDMEVIESLFISDTVRLLAVSGSGKTRRTLEGLCHYWGFYITSQKGKIGSHDFELAINIIKSMNGWDSDADMQKLSLGENVSVANRAFAMLICARAFVLKHLLKNLPANTDVGVARKRWVLAQVLPPSLSCGVDIFTTIIKSIRGASEWDMLDVARAMLGEADMVKNEPFFVVINEAQVAAEYLSDSFRSLTSGTDLRPVLHAFYKFLKKSYFFEGVIHTGTGLSINKMKESLFAQVAKPMGERQVPTVFVELGLFMGDQIHKNYIHKYSSLSANISDERLLERIFHWFSGRYRFTASLFEVLFSTQPSSPHRIISAFVKSMTQFTITDAIDLEKEEPELTDATISKIRTYGQFDQISILFEKGNGELIRCLFDALMRWRIGSETTAIPIEGNMHELVALGVGHLEKAGPHLTLDPTSNYPVYLCEPLVVLFLSSSFNKHFRMRETLQEKWIMDSFRTTRNTSSRGLIFEEAVLLMLLQKFGGRPCALSDVFDCNQPWGSRKLTLVSLKRVNGSMQCCHVSWTSGSSDRLGSKAASPKHVLTFMNNPDGKCFIFPDNHMGPDLLFFLQDVETKELILCGLQCKSVFPKVDLEGWQDALKSVTPDFFYTIDTNNDTVQYAPLKYPGLSDEIIATIQLMLGPEEYKPEIEEYYRAKLRSSTAVNKQLESKPSRETPKYLRLIATLEPDQQWESESSDDVAVLRREHVDSFFGSTTDIVMGSPSVV